MLEILQPQRLSEGVVQRVLEAVRSGSLAPGGKLPSERELAEQLGVSRVSVREGLRVLELLEVIEVRQGRGAFVISPDVRPGGRLLRHWLLGHKTEVIDLLQVREALEASAAHAAARRHAQVEVPPMGPDDPIDGLVEADLAFHDRVAAASGNVVLASLIQELNGVLEESRFAMFALPGRPSISHREHLAIAAAISRGDEVAAREAMRRHITRTRDQVAALKEHKEST